MIKTSALFLKREDLERSKRKLPITKIRFTDFTSSSYNNILKHAIVIFIDNNKSTRILKNRDGNIGMVVKDVQ